MNEDNLSMGAISAKFSVEIRCAKVSEGSMEKSHWGLPHDNFALGFERVRTAKIIGSWAMG